MSRPSEVYVRPLSTDEQEWVHRLYQHTIHVGLKSRCHIILLSSEHYSVPQIAGLLFTSEDTVARCIHEFNRSGLEGILPQERAGRPVKITEEFLKQVLELVESDPRDVHYPFSTWTAELLAVALKEHTGLEVSASSVRRCLHRQGYSVQRPVLSVSSPDPDYEQKWARLQELQQRARAGEIDLYDEDEVDLALLPRLMRCWSKQGHQRKMETPRQNKKQYGAGLIQWTNGKLCWATSEHKDNALFRSLLTQLLAAHTHDLAAKSTWWWTSIASILHSRSKPCWPSIRMKLNWSSCRRIPQSSILWNASGSTCAARSLIPISSRPWTDSWML